ncbi:MAG: hypothetical protein O3A19_08650 [Planctomycetota bacterium]|nr:hypothetical protein [Planctomycetota bacterium]
MRRFQLFSLIAFVVSTAAFLPSASAFATATAIQDDAKIAPLPSAKDVVAMMIKAQGGEAAMSKHPSSTITGKFSMPAMEMGGPMSIQNASGKMLVIVNITGFGKSTQGFRDGIGWTMDPASGPALVEGAMLDAMKRQANPRGDLDLFKTWKSVKVTGREVFAEKNCLVLELQTGQEKEVRLIEETTGTLVGSRTTQSSPMGEIPIVTTIEAWTEFDGLKVPSKLSMSMIGQQRLVEFDSMNFDPITPETFDFPPAIKALIADKEAREAEAKKNPSDPETSSDSSSSKDTSEDSSSKDSSKDGSSNPSSNSDGG